MKLRLIKIIFFMPCCLIDGITFFIIILPMWILIGNQTFKKESLLEWLLNNNN